jgi:hypothetical protein
MTGRPQILKTTLFTVILLTTLLSACGPKTVEVTRVTVKERRVIEYVEATVEVTRIQRIIETPTPTMDDPGLQPTPSPSPPQPTPTPAPVIEAQPTAATFSARGSGERLLAAVGDMEQALLTLVQDLNSDPLPGAHILELYAAIRAAPTLDIPAEEGVLLAIYTRYREQVDYVLGQATDLTTHLQAIESGEATQTEVSTTHLALARNAASDSTSTLQGLARELEEFLAAQP